MAISLGDGRAGANLAHRRGGWAFWRATDGADSLTVARNEAWLCTHRTLATAVNFEPESLPQARRAVTINLIAISACCVCVRGSFGMIFFKRYCWNAGCGVCKSPRAVGGWAATACPRLPIVCLCKALGLSLDGLSDPQSHRQTG